VGYTATAKVVDAQARPHEPSEEEISSSRALQAEIVVDINIVT
jgi:hypothetical protein